MLKIDFQFVKSKSMTHSNTIIYSLGEKEVQPPPEQKLPRLEDDLNPLVGPAGPRPELDSKVDLYGCSKYFVKMTKEVCILIRANSF